MWNAEWGVRNEQPENPFTSLLIHFALSLSFQSASIIARNLAI